MKILVIEDTAKHIEDAKAFFASIPELQVTFVTARRGGEYRIKGKDEVRPGALDLLTSKDEFRQLKLYRNEFDGVISDIFFPDYEWMEARHPMGLGVFMLCQQLNLPCVLNTAGYHHGDKYEWINSTLRLLGIEAFVDSSNSENESDSKNWANAWELLQKQMQS